MSAADRFTLAGRRALVTGASSGLGRHFARTLAEAGATVIVAARSVDKLAATVAEIEAAGGRRRRCASTSPTWRASRPGSMRSRPRAGVADVIVNNAGLAVSRPLLEQTEADWDTVLDTNLKGAWLVAQEGARRLVAAKRGGSIVNIASITGERSRRGRAVLHVEGRRHAPDPRDGARAGAPRSARQRARSRLRADRAEPGLPLVRGRRAAASAHPQRRFGSADELDGPLLLLASDAGAYITGSVLCADGGHLVSSL
jgi:NAD(P)-dependent dehydrogenase (short-subunit alcohol dehydrogenase family)